MLGMLATVALLPPHSVGALAALRRSSLLAMLSAVSAFAPARAESLPPSPLEETVCGAFAERWAFQNWALAAGSPDDSLVAQVSNVSRKEFATEDGRTLVGFRLPAQGRPTGSLLFIQGNGMLVDRALRWLVPFADAGLDVYLYDFRGYGRSNGNRRLQAMTSDYRALLSHLATSAKQPVHVYAVSFGGVLLLNAINALPPTGRAVIDSTPSLVSPLGCPENFDPVRHVPPSAERLLFLAGSKDNVIPSATTQALSRAIAAARGRATVLDGFGHPFTGSPEDHFRRLTHVVQFLTDTPIDAK